MNSKRLPVGANLSPYSLRGSHLAFCCRVSLAWMLLFLLGGCGSSLPSLERLRPIPAEEKICNVAVLPFVSDSNYPLSAIVAYKVFSAKLTELTNYSVTSEGDIASLFQELRILPGQSPDKEQLQLILNRLDDQLIFTGHVLEMREDPSKNGGINPVLVMQVDILDGHTGKILQSIYNRRQGDDYIKIMHFGKINSIAGLCQQVSSELINLSLKQGLSQCDASFQP